MITVLVTGSQGQLGRCLYEASKKTSNIQWFFKSSHELNITSENSIQQAFENNKIDYLINCAAYTAVDRAESEKEKVFLVNAEGVRLLATACKEHHATLIQISTDFVFEGKKNSPYLETDLPNPINIYGASKLKGEQYIPQILTDYIIIRTSWVYSEYGNNFVKTMLRLANERTEINVVDDQIGSPTYAGDLSEFIIYLILNDKRINGIFHYTNIGQISWYEFALRIFKEKMIKMKVNPIKSNEFPSLAERPKYSVLNNDKRKALVDNQLTTWEFSLVNCLSKLNENGIMYES